MSEFVDRELDWEDEIENDADEWVIFPVGDYDFEVVGFERARHNGSAKLPPCNKAIIDIKLFAYDGKSTTIKHNLFLYSTTEGMICAFFTGIGQRKKGEKISMNWNKVIGSKGRCKVGIRNFTNDKGEKMEFNEIKKFYEPEESAPTSQGGFTPGKF